MIKNVTQIFILDVITVVTYILFSIYAVGYSTNAKKYLDIINSFVKIYISFFLMWRFNPFRTITVSPLDKKIIFSGGIFLFSTTIVHTILLKYIELTAKKTHLKIT
uniref:Uncharacterized protein n=1 Tax=viral metagenome TaxID=1070528 RepID=A0A6C0HSE2_9ZZZZ